jgi:hypothetical protein
MMSIFAVFKAFCGVSPFSLSSVLYSFVTIFAYFLGSCYFSSVDWFISLVMDISYIPVYSSGIAVFTSTAISCNNVS